MKKTDLQRLDGSGEQSALVSGGGAEAPNGKNLLASARAIIRLQEEMDEYDISSYADLPSDKQTELDEAFEDLQYNWKALANMMAGWTGSDAGLEDEGGTTLVDSGVSASTGSTSPDIPSDPSGS